MLCASQEKSIYPVLMIQTDFIEQLFCMRSLKDQVSVVSHVQGMMLKKCMSS